MAGRLGFFKFGGGDPLCGLQTYQSRYLQSYLSQQGAQSVIEEPRYFDRDYLAEFAAYYSTSARSYGNSCRRLHFFSTKVDRQKLSSAASGSKRALRILQSSYLGFMVIRPLPFAPIGRTVLTWYPQPLVGPQRITQPARDYHAHLAGIRLTVHGLAWQQQDTSVGACATVALWTMLHSSAFSDYHAIPTTAEITRLAHRRAGLGARVFPSGGLTYEQIREAIKECGLAPAICAGDILPTAEKPLAGFTRERFASSCAALLRSGYPILIGGLAVGLGAHAIVAVGFKEAPPSSTTSGNVALQDGDISYIYINDDNLGPNARFEIAGGSSDSDPVRLVRSPPPGTETLDPTRQHPDFIPNMLVAAVNEGLLVTPDGLHLAGMTVASNLSVLFSAAAPQTVPGVTLSVRFLRLADYVGPELGRTLATNPRALVRARLALQESPHPMSLHLGVIRVGLGTLPLVDVLYDTTNGDRHITPFGHLAFVPVIEQAVPILKQRAALELGRGVRAF